MPGSRRSGRSCTMAIDLVVDADGHCSEPAESWRGGCPRVCAPRAQSSRTTGADTHAHRGPHLGQSEGWPERQRPVRAAHPAVAARDGGPGAAPARHGRGGHRRRRHLRHADRAHGQRPAGQGAGRRPLPRGQPLAGGVLRGRPQAAEGRGADPVPGPARGREGAGVPGRSTGIVSAMLPHERLWHQPGRPALRSDLRRGAGDRTCRSPSTRRPATTASTASRA